MKLGASLFAALLVLLAAQPAAAQSSYPNRPVKIFVGETVKTLALPEWWLLWPMPVAFVLLSVEFVFRIRRLALSERQPRDDAVSAS